jgi:hypothetical protein
MSQERITRREAVARTALGAAAAVAVAKGAPRVWASPRQTPRGAEPRAKAVIEIWMAGGPSHIDTFDPKPGAGRDYCGPLDQPVATKANGMRIGQSLPMIAEQGDKFSLIRSMTHGINGHETAAYTMQTGRRTGEGEKALVFPSFGAVVSMFKGYEHGYRGMIPPYVVLTRPQGRFAVEGFLGLAHKPFVTGGDPRRDRFAVEGIVLDGVSDERQKSRRELLGKLDTLGGALPGEPAFEKLKEAQEKAYDLILGDAGKVFDLTTETDAVRDRYGRTTFGQSCLAARRLVEQGVPYVTVNVGGWDTHKRHFEAMRQRLPDFDRGLSALLEDLHQRGTLESTILWCTGEFGRTPKVMWEEPWNGGRGHFGQAFSVLVAGGGFQGGRVVGETNETATEVVERPVAPHDLFATMHELLGIDPDGPLPNPRGLDVTVQPPSKTGRGVGRLRELT